MAIQADTAGSADGQKGPEADCRGPSDPVVGTAYAATPAPVRGSSTTIAVFPERIAARAS